MWKKEIGHTIPVSHAVEEEPGRVIFPILHKGYIMARFYAEHSKQLHLLAGDAAVSPIPVRQIFGEWHWVIFMIQPLGMKVDLKGIIKRTSEMSPMKRFKQRDSTFNNIQRKQNPQQTVSLMSISPSAEGTHNIIVLCISKAKYKLTGF